MPGRIRIESLLHKYGFIRFSYHFLHKRKDWNSLKNTAVWEGWPIKKREKCLESRLCWAEEGWLWRLTCLSLFGFALLLGLLLGDKATLIPVRINRGSGLGKNSESVVFNPPLLKAPALKQRKLFIFFPLSLLYCLLDLEITTALRLALFQSSFFISSLTFLCFILFC